MVQAVVTTMQPLEASAMQRDSNVMGIDIAKRVWLLLDSRVVDVLRSSNPIVVPLSSSHSFFFNGLKKVVHFSGNVRA